MTTRSLRIIKATRLIRRSSLKTRPPKTAIVKTCDSFSKAYSKSRYPTSVFAKIIIQATKTDPVSILPGSSPKSITPHKMTVKIHNFIRKSNKGFIAFLFWAGHCRHYFFLFAAFSTFMRTSAMPTIPKSTPRRKSHGEVPSWRSAQYPSSTKKQNSPLSVRQALYSRTLPASSGRNCPETVRCQDLPSGMSSLFAEWLGA